MTEQAAARDPSARVAEVFARIAATRMRDFPLSNPQLSVETVGFRAWEGLWVGVLIAPWSMNLLLLPDVHNPHPEFRVLATAQEQTWRFPSGEYVFYGLDEPGLGPCQMCSLFSPLADIPTQAQAVEVAREVMQALFVDPQAALAAAAPASVSRRAFLRGRTAGSAR